MVCFSFLHAAFFICGFCVFCVVTVGFVSLYVSEFLTFACGVSLLRERPKDSALWNPAALERLANFFLWVRVCWCCSPEYKKQKPWECPPHCERCFFMNVEITTEYIKLDQLLKFSGVCVTGSDAKQLIIDGNVSVNGEVCSMRGKKIRSGDSVSVNGNIITVSQKG